MYMIGLMVGNVNLLKGKYCWYIMIDFFLLLRILNILEIL